MNSDKETIRVLLSEISDLKERLKRVEQLQNQRIEMEIRKIIKG